MTLTQLEYIVAIDTYRHFATAADKCSVTQPTLSMQIQKLEDELNLKIFDRSKQPVVPTEIGRAILIQARKILKESYKVREIISDHRQEISGELRIGIIPTLAPYLLPLFLNNFLQKFPAVKLKVVELTTTQLITKLKTERIDVGIIVTPVNDESLLEQPLFYEEFIAYLSSSELAYQKKFLLSTDIDLSRLWLLEEGHCIRSQIMNICELRKQQSDSQHFEYEAGSIETLRKMVEKHGGITILPELVLNDLTPEQLLQTRRFEAPAPVREVSLVTHRNYVKKSLIDALKQEIIAVIPKEMLNPKDRKVIDL